MNRTTARDNRRPLSFDVLEDRSTPALLTVSILSIEVSMSSVQPMVSTVSRPIMVIETPVRAISITPAAPSMPNLPVQTPGATPQRPPADSVDVPAVVNNQNNSGSTARGQNQVESNAFAYSVPLNQNSTNYTSGPVAFAADSNRMNNLFSTPLSENLARAVAPATADAFGPGVFGEDAAPANNANTTEGQTPQTAPSSDATNESPGNSRNNATTPAGLPLGGESEEATAVSQGDAGSQSSEEASEGVSVRALSIAIGSAALALGAGAYVVLRSTQKEESALPALATQRPLEKVEG